MLEGSAHEMCEGGYIISLNAIFRGGQFLVMLECDFPWQVQHLVLLEGDFCCSAHRPGRFMFGEDEAPNVLFRGRGHYLVMLDNGFCCFAHCNGRFMR